MNEENKINDSSGQPPASPEQPVEGQQANLQAPPQQTIVESNQPPADESGQQSGQEGDNTGQENGEQDPPPPKEESKPNVRLAAKKSPAAVNGPINIGRDGTVNLPDEEAQRAGFYTEKVHLLIQQFPQYLRITPKG